MALLSLRLECSVPELTLSQESNPVTQAHGNVVPRRKGRAGPGALRRRPLHGSLLLSVSLAPSLSLAPV